MMQFIKNLVVVAVGVAVLYFTYTLWLDHESAKSIPESNNNSTGLVLPAGFKAEIFAKDLPGARVMVWDELGNMWVSRTSEGVITQLEVKEGAVTAQHDVFRNLRNPHGLAFDYRTPNLLYFAEEHQISRVTLYSDDRGEKIADLPTAGGGHFTRTIGFGPEDLRLYVSIGSSCNACEESDERRAAIYSMNPDGSDFKRFAAGLRNTVFFTWSYVDGRMWGTDMGRDHLGDDLPPEEINILQQGQDYGWPICYGQNIHDTDFDQRTYIRNPCEDKTAPAVEMQAHSAPLGLAFVPEEGWPEDYWYDLIVALHGSWNRSERTGYKLIRVKLDAEGNFEGTEDFATGWLKNGKVSGRPADVLIQPGGVMYVSDDEAGVIYKFSYTSHAN